MDGNFDIASKEGNKVFDPFMGVGPTGFAALNSAGKFIGKGIDEMYFKAAEKKIKTDAHHLKLFT